MAAGKVVGLEKVMANLNREVARIKERTAAGLLEAGLQIERVAKGRVPVDTGNLKNSGYTRKSGPLTVEVGFTAFYAIFVHENLEARHHVGQAKFLQSAVADNADKILAIIRKQAAVS